jgi:hypothetical protein
MALFLPGLVVAIGYAALWIILFVNGRGDGALARVCLLVLVIVVPLLFAYAGLRLSTTRLMLRGAHLEAHPGFPARDPIVVNYPAVAGLTLRRGLSGWITGAGSLVIERENGPAVIVSACPILMRRSPIFRNGAGHSRGRNSRTEIPRGRRNAGHGQVCCLLSGPDLTVKHAIRRRAGLKDQNRQKDQASKHRHQRNTHCRDAFPAGGSG